MRSSNRPGRSVAKLLGRLLVLALLLAAAQIAIAPLLRPLSERDFPNLKLFSRSLREKKEILFFGDSTLAAAGEKDSDRRGIVEMMAGDIAPRSIQGILFPAYNPEVYLEYLKHLRGCPAPPKIVIMTINLRSFSPSWDMNPRWQFEKLRIVLRATGWKFYLYRPLQVLQFDFSTVSRKRMESAGVFDGAVRVGALRDFMPKETRLERGTQLNIRNALLSSYMGDIPAGQRKLAALKALARLLPRLGITPVFYITPVDYQTGEAFFPKKFRERLTHNGAVIRGALASQGAPLLDLATALDSQAFAWRQDVYPNEHLNEAGRSFVARRLCRQVLAVMGPAGVRGAKNESPAPQRQTP